MTVYAGMQMRRRGGTGRHAILRGLWRKPYEFESHRRYHGYFANRIRSLSLKAYSEQASLTIRGIPAQRVHRQNRSCFWEGRMRNLLTEWLRRRAVGVDLHPCAVRALVFRRCVFKPHRGQIERRGMSALPEGAVNGAELANPDAVCTALTEAVFAGQRPSKQPDAPKTCAAHIAAALPQGAVVEYSAS